MKKLTKCIACILAASSLSVTSAAFAHGGQGGGGHWHPHGGGGHWHPHGGGGHWHHWHHGWRWHPFAGPRFALGVAAAAIGTAAVVSAASRPRVAYRDVPTRVRHCHIDDGYRICKTVTYH